MAYLPRRARVLGGLSGVENCGMDQVWDPNIEVYGSKGQCMPRKNYAASQLVNPNAFPGVVKSNAPAGPSALTTAASSIVGSIIGSLTAPKPQQQVVVQAPASKISPAVAIGIGAGALALIFIATRR